MRELMLFIASLAAAIVLAALAVLIRPEALLWNAFLWVGTAVFLVACGFLLSDYWRSGLQMMITNVAFDPNGPSEIYVAFRLANSGEPTTLDGWNLTIKRKKAVLWKEQPPRVAFQPTYNQSTNRLDPPLDLSRNPIQRGAQLRPRFTWTYQGNAKETFGHPGTKFHLSAVDIRGRNVGADYVL